MRKFFTYAIKSLLLTLLVTTFVCSCKDDDELVVATLSLETESVYLNSFSEQMTIGFSCTSAVRVHVDNVPEGWKVEANFANRSITITSPSEDNKDAVMSGTATIYVFSSTAQGTSKNLHMSIETPVDLSEQRSNCYIISQSDCSYLIPISYKGESEERITPAKVELLWQSPGEIINSIKRFGSEHIAFHVNSSDDGELTPGNAYIVARDDKDNIIWGWHLWITTSQPESRGKYMDRNLGSAYAEAQTQTADILRNYGTYYQWGRPTPFVGPYSYNCASSIDAYMYSTGSSKTMRIEYVESSAECGTMEYAIANPLSYILGNEESDYDWNFEHDNNLWSTTNKSLYDPCPKGWRVADSFNGLELKSSLDNLDALKTQYGFVLGNEQMESFFMGAGRRSWLNGLITNMNETTVPQPWIGYYWSAESKDENESRAMFFELDTESVAESELYTQMAAARANGMQVRCMRE